MNNNNRFLRYFLTVCFISLLGLILAGCRKPVPKADIDELKARDNVTIHMHDLQPNMWYGNKNVPQKNEENYIYPMSTGSFPLPEGGQNRWFLFREKLKEVAQPGPFSYTQQYNDTCWDYEKKWVGILYPRDKVCIEQKPRAANQRGYESAIRRSPP